MSNEYPVLNNAAGNVMPRPLPLYGHAMQLAQAMPALTDGTRWGDLAAQPAAAPEAPAQLWKAPAWSGDGAGLSFPAAEILPQADAVEMFDEAKDSHAAPAPMPPSDVASATPAATAAVPAATADGTRQRRVDMPPEAPVPDRHRVPLANAQMAQDAPDESAAHDARQDRVNVAATPPPETPWPRTPAAPARVASDATRTAAASEDPLPVSSAPIPPVAHRAELPAAQAVPAHVTSPGHRVPVATETATANDAAVPGGHRFPVARTDVAQDAPDAPDASAYGVRPHRANVAARVAFDAVQTAAASVSAAIHYRRLPQSTPPRQQASPYIAQPAPSRNSLNTPAAMATSPGPTPVSIGAVPPAVRGTEPPVGMVVPAHATILGQHRAPMATKAVATHDAAASGQQRVPVIKTNMAPEAPDAPDGADAPAYDVRPHHANVAAESPLDAPRPAAAAHAALDTAQTAASSAPAAFRYRRLSRSTTPQQQGDPLIPQPAQRRKNLSAPDAVPASAGRAPAAMMPVHPAAHSTEPPAAKVLPTHAAVPGQRRIPVATTHMTLDAPGAPDASAAAAPTSIAAIQPAAHHAAARALKTAATRMAMPHKHQLPVDRTSAARHAPSYDTPYDTPYNQLPRHTTMPFQASRATVMPQPAATPPRTIPNLVQTGCRRTEIHYRALPEPASAPPQGRPSILRPSRQRSAPSMPGAPRTLSGLRASETSPAAPAAKIQPAYRMQAPMAKDAATQAAAARQHLDHAIGIATPPVAQASDALPRRTTVPAISPRTTLRPQPATTPVRPASVATQASARPAPAAINYRRLPGAAPARQDGRSSILQSAQRRSRPTPPDALAAPATPTPAAMARIEPAAQRTATPVKTAPASANAAQGKPAPLAATGKPSAIVPQAPALAPQRSAGNNDDTPMTVRVNIGRIRIEGAPRPQAPTQRFQRPAPALTLAQYAQRRNGGRP